MDYISIITGFIGAFIGAIIGFGFDFTKTKIETSKHEKSILSVLKIELSKIKGVLTILEDRSKNNNILLHESPIINKKNYFNLFVSDIALMEKKKSLAIIEIYDSIFAFEEIRSYLTKNKNLRDKVDAKQRNNLQDFNVEEQMYKANEDAYIEKIREINKNLLPVLEVIEKTI